jgi:hypothetical protein
LSTHEILAAISLGIAALLALGVALWLYYQPYAETPDFYERRLSLFLTFTPPFGVMVAVSAVFFVRAIQDDVRYFSSLAHFALAWPLLSYLLPLLLPFLAIQAGIISFASVGFAIVATVKSVVAKRGWADVLTIPLAAALSFAWFLICREFFWELWLVYGD